MRHGVAAVGNPVIVIIRIVHIRGAIAIRVVNYQPHLGHLAPAPCHKVPLQLEHPVSGRFDRNIKLPRRIDLGTYLTMDKVGLIGGTGHGRIETPRIGTPHAILGHRIKIVIGHIKGLIEQRIGLILPGKSSAPSIFSFEIEIVPIVFLSGGIHISGIFLPRQLTKEVRLAIDRTEIIVKPTYSGVFPVYERLQMGDLLRLTSQGGNHFKLVEQEWAVIGGVIERVEQCTPLRIPGEIGGVHTGLEPDVIP